MILEKYIKEISRYLKCTKSKKIAICKDLQADITCAIENGEMWEEIQERMGLPEELASEFNENLQEMGKPSKKKAIILFLVAFLILLGIISTVVIIQQKASSKNIFSKCGETSFVNIAEKIVTLINEDDYTIIEEEYTENNLKNTLPMKTITNTKESLSTKNLGKFQKIVSSNVYQEDEQNSSYGIVEIKALYENSDMIYTLSFDKNLKLWSIVYDNKD